MCKNIRTTSVGQNILVLIKESVYKKFIVHITKAVLFAIFIV